MHRISMPYLAKELSKPPVCTSRAPETMRRISEKQSRWIVVVDFSCLKDLMYKHEEDALNLH